MLADGGRHSCIFIQLQSLDGDPLPAPHEVWVSLSSSNLEVGSVETPIVIPEGEYLKTAYFSATQRPGETVITASAPGFTPGRASLRTFDPHASTSPPYSLRVYASPSFIPAEYGLRGNITVQIVDSEGVPITAASEVEVKITSSNTSILKIPSSLTIRDGENYGSISFSTLGVVGRTTITALSGGFIPGNATVSATGFGGPPTRLSLSLTPSTLLPGGSIHDSITIQLLDSEGVPTRAREPVSIYLSSSNLDVAVVERPYVTLEPGRHYTTARLITGFKPGKTVIAAAAQGLETSLATLEVRGSTPSRLYLYAALPMILAEGESREVLVLQVQSREGIPMVSPEDVEVYLASSSRLVGDVPSKIRIRRGESYVKIPLRSTLIPGDIEIIAHTQDLEASTATISTTALPMNLTIEAPSAVQINQTFTVTVTAKSGSQPLKNASVSWGIRGGELISTEGSTGSSGSAYGVLKQTWERLELSIEVSKPGYRASRVEKAIIALALPSPPPEPRLNILGLEVPISSLIITIAITITVLIILYLYLRRKRNKISREIDLKDKAAN
ncbi:Ig-like domain-containing protein [Candidatus Bathyarchaeota archaeon]|nr:Ig-like domain-containing protein [Candidatus Bathyarchaeota archaeon]